MSDDVEDPVADVPADPAGADAPDRPTSAPPASLDNDPGPQETLVTGVASVDAAARRLTELDDAPVETHVGIYEDVHHRLQEGLADLDEQ